MVHFLLPSEVLDAGAQFDLPGPGAARLAVQRQIGGSDRVRIEQAVGAALVGARIALFSDAALDPDGADMDVLRLQLPRQALRQAAQCELAHPPRRVIPMT